MINVRIRVWPLRKRVVRSSFGCLHKTQWPNWKCDRCCLSKSQRMWSSILSSKSWKGCMQPARLERQLHCFISICRHWWWFYSFWCYQMPKLVRSRLVQSYIWKTEIFYLIKVEWLLNMVQSNVMLHSWFCKTLTFFSVRSQYANRTNFTTGNETSQTIYEWIEKDLYNGKNELLLI